ncbi:MAG: hypothetical protein V2I50_08160 [Desulfuromusa sp.]|nr:hypothetical protein [Desulfuromusa sp.]
MHHDLFNLISFLNHNPALKLLISNMQQSDNHFWLVGGCLRNSLLDLPQVDIDIACSSDPTVLARAWSHEVSAHWFCLDVNRKQSRVLLPSGLTLDFSPLRSSSIIADLCLRDFTVNAMALPVDTLSTNSLVLDPLDGLSHLHKKQLHCCSDRSFIDDPLRMLKGIRHAVTLDFELSNDTLKQIKASKQLLSNTAGERIRDELSKIFNSDKSIEGVEVLIDTGLLDVLFGAEGKCWNKGRAIREIDELDKKIHQVGLKKIYDLSVLKQTDSFSVRAIFLFSELLKNYEPVKLSKLLHNRLRLSRQQQSLIKELQLKPDLQSLSLLASVEGQRRQALLAEKHGKFFIEKILYWGVCRNLVTLDRAIELHKSFTHEQKRGRVPAMLNGKMISSLLGSDQDSQIGYWQEQLKLAEIKGEISTILEAENWLKSKLSFDKKEA